VIVGATRRRAPQRQEAYNPFRARSITWCPGFRS